MTGSSDIAPLFAGGPDDRGGFRQGSIVAWDQATGTNTVNVNGTLLTDLPVLTPGDFVALQAGDVVVLAKYRSTWFILGRIIPPSVPDRNRFVVDFDAKEDSPGTGYVLTTTPTTQASVVFTPPLWADEVAVTVSCIAQGFNSPATVNDYLNVQPFVNGVGLKGGRGGADIGGTTFAASGSNTILSPVPGTITVEAKVWTQDHTWSDAPINNDVNLSVLVFYRRND